MGSILRSLLSFSLSLSLSRNMAWNGMVWLLVTRSTKECEKRGVKRPKNVKFMVAWEIKGQMVTTNTFPSLSLSLFLSFTLSPYPSSSLPLACLPCLACLFVFACLLPSLVLHLAVVPVTYLTQTPQSSQRLVPPTLSRFFFFSCHHNCLSSLPSPSLSPSFFLSSTFIFLYFPFSHSQIASTSLQLLFTPILIHTLQLTLTPAPIHIHTQNTYTNNSAYTHTLIFLRGCTSEPY
ncbi:hypothetical protein BKA57DRAFT_22731 [Linnemannia elongata]|nr:hypothetical protein BKA57DRAFT_22731 [Linnemannia elongata]